MLNLNHSKPKLYLLVSFFLPILGFVLLGCLLGCESGPENYDEWSAEEKARKVKLLREEAEVCREKYLRSMDDSGGVDLEALECFVSKHKETTDIYPSPARCPLCYANYGRGLHQLGLYYLVLRKKLEQELPEAAPEKRAEIEERIAEFNELVETSFRQSLQQFESYFRSGSGVDYRTYDWSMRMAFELKDYRRALRYLDLRVQNGPVNDEEKKTYKGFRERIQRLYERQQIRRYSDEVGD